jgi:hypothetical protein
MDVDGLLARYVTSKSFELSPQLTFSTVLLSFSQQHFLVSLALYL